jgi:L-alanine-DL-glutamate epimerase-like enolase superfamily enzyme
MGHGRAARLSLPRSLLGALDTAFGDLKGKLLGQSIASLLGGVWRERVPAHASLHNYSASPDCGDGLADLILDARAKST